MTATAFPSGYKGMRGDILIALKKSQTLTAKELATRFGVTANAVAPSILDTPANRAAMPEADYSTWVPPQDVAAAIEFLCSEEAGHLRGAWLPLTGAA